MSERFEWKPSKDEIERLPNINFVCQLGRFSLYAANTSLFTYRKEVFDNFYEHIFHYRVPGLPWPKEVSTDFIPIPKNYIATEEYAEAYQTMRNYMLENEYQAHMNLTELTSADKRMIDAMIMGDLRQADYIPESWEE